MFPITEENMQLPLGKSLKKRLSCCDSSKQFSNAKYMVPLHLFCFVLFRFILAANRHHIDYRTLGSQAAANLLGEVTEKTNKSLFGTHN